METASLCFHGCVLCSVSPTALCFHKYILSPAAALCFQGLLGDDMVLAGALWRIFFEMRHDVDPAHLELMVAYVRKQVRVSVKGS